MSEIVGYDITPDAGTTLRKMLKLNLYPFLPQFEEVSVGATKVSAVVVTFSFVDDLPRSPGSSLYIVSWNDLSRTLSSVFAPVRLASESVAFEDICVKLRKDTRVLHQKYSAWILVSVGAVFMRIFAGVLWKERAKQLWVIGVRSWNSNVRVYPLPNAA